MRIADEDGRKAYAKMVEQFSSGEEITVAVGRHLVMEPCMDPGSLAVIQRDTGRPCPRVELDRENEFPFYLANLMRAPSTRPFVPLVFNEAYRRASTERRLAVLMRTVTAAQDPDANPDLDSVAVGDFVEALTGEEE